MAEQMSPRGRPPEPSGGGPWKWLIGAAVAALVVGGGYYAWQNYSASGPSSDQVAYTEPSDEPYASGDPIPPSEGNLSDVAPTDEAPPPASTAKEKQTASATPPRAKAPAPVVEEVIGVAPPSTTTTTAESDEITVPGARTIWARRPNARRLSAAYPARALERGREGEASLRCTVQAEGALDCVRVSETPSNAGFGAAALRVARMYRHGPRRADGSVAAGSAINLRVIFRMADEDRRRRG